MRIDDSRPQAPDLDLDLPDLDRGLDLERKSQAERQASPARVASPELRAELVQKSSDHDPPELLAFYAGLRAQVASPTGTDATDATHATEASRDAVAGSRMDALRDAFSGPYAVDGQKVTAPPMFRLNGGANEASMKAHEKRLDHVAEKVHQSGAAMRIGCASPVALVKVTQALIDAGQLPPGPGDAAARIRQMQWTWGIGVDCAAYTRQAFETANGLSASQLTALHVDALGMENFRGLDANRGFAKIGPSEVRPGDIITLDEKPGGRWGHNVLVRSNTVADDHAASAFAAQHGPLAKAFLQGAGPFHMIEVDSSWGAGADGAGYGGYRRDTWLYDSSRRMWGFLDPTSTPAAFRLSQNGPATDDVYHGAYRPKVGT